MLSLLVSSGKGVQNQGGGKDRDPLLGADPQAHTSPASTESQGSDSKGGFAASVPGVVVLCCFPGGKSSNFCSFSFSFSVSSPPYTATNSLPKSSKHFFLDVTDGSSCWYESKWGGGCPRLTPASALG